MATWSVISLLLLILYCQQASAYERFWRNQFQQWYPTFGPAFVYIRDTDCRNEFNIYLQGNLTTGWSNLIGGESNNRLVQPLADCILEHTSEFIKSNLASAQVLMGLLPTILSMLGPSIEEISALCIVGRRPFLSLLIVCGAPAVFPNRNFKLDDPAKTIHDHQSQITHHVRWSSSTERTVLALEYVVAMGSVVNLVHTCYFVGIQSICNYAAERPYIPLMWAGLGVSAHLLGCTIIYLRIEYKSANQAMPQVPFWRAQIVPFNEQAPTEFTVKPESRWLVVMSWSTSIMIVTYIIFGALSWSSLVFISVKDATGIVSRLMVSAIASRSVLIYELSMLKDAYVDPHHSLEPVTMQMMQTTPAVSNLGGNTRLTGPRLHVV